MAEDVKNDYEFRLKRGTSVRWHQLNPVLAPGEPGFESDTRRLKIGDGFKAWRDLDYVSEIDYSGGGATSDPRVGNMNDLTTEARTSIVAAINELNFEDVSLLLFYNNAKAG